MKPQLQLPSRLPQMVLRRAVRLRLLHTLRRCIGPSKI